jgi:hypothetical protein
MWPSFAHDPTIKSSARARVGGTPSRPVSSHVYLRMLFLGQLDQAFLQQLAQCGMRKIGFAKQAHDVAQSSKARHHSEQTAFKRIQLHLIGQHFTLTGVRTLKNAVGAGGLWGVLHGEPSISKLEKNQSALAICHQKQAMWIWLEAYAKKRGSVASTLGLLG